MRSGLARDLTDCTPGPSPGRLRRPGWLPAAVDAAIRGMEFCSLQRVLAERVAADALPPYVRSVLLRRLRRWRPDTGPAEVETLLSRVRLAARHAPQHAAFVFLRSLCNG